MTDREIEFEQYRIMVDSAIKITEWRQTANRFYITILTGLIAVGSFVVEQTGSGPNLLPILCTFGCFFCVFWALHISEYRALNCAKFKVISKIEENLPSQPFSDENKFHKSCLGKLEQFTPLFLFGLFLILTLVYSNPWETTEESNVMDQQTTIQSAP